MKLQLKSIWLTNSKGMGITSRHVTDSGRKRSHSSDSSHQIKVKNNHKCFLLLRAPCFKFKLDLLYYFLIKSGYCYCCWTCTACLAAVSCLSRSCVLLWLVHWRLYATTGVVTALYYTISKKIISFFVPQAIPERLVQLSKIIDKWSLKNSKKTSSSLMQSQKS